MTVDRTIGFWISVPVTTVATVSAAFSVAWAGDLPSGGVVTAGSATISADGAAGLFAEAPDWRRVRTPQQALCTMSDGTAPCLDTSPISDLNQGIGGKSPPE